MEDSLTTTENSFLSQCTAALRALPEDEQRRFFRTAVRRYYRQFGRVLPWRETEDWYEILVSEIMLQQTQVERVLPKYEAFLRRFPSPTVLARAHQSTVLKYWQGLGYNRRARGLQQCVQAVLCDFGGTLPKSEVELATLPGVGEYTAAALRAFVWNKPSSVVETNIRTVMVHFFLWQNQTASEVDVRRLVTQTTPKSNVREWYYALMDIGAALKRSGFRYNSRMKGYRKQAAFLGSNRQLRGFIVRELTLHRKQTLASMLSSVPSALLVGGSFPAETLQAACQRLCEEGLLCRDGRFYRLAK